MSFSAGREPKIVVLDDDPTGIQMVHDVAVYTSWEESACVNLLREEETMVFILTNTRALKPEAARRLLRECTQNLMAASKQTGVPFWLVLRSDSTLRGHYPLESETVREVLQEQGIEVAGEILCPYLQGMRITRDDLHYLKQEDRWLPVGESEFAWDKTFGFHASDLKAYVEEKTQGRYPAASCLSISLEILRSQDEAAITRILRQAHDFQKIIINAETDDDLRALMPPLKTVLKEKTFLFRTAASFCKIYADQSEKPLMDPQACVQRKNQNGGLSPVRMFRKRRVSWKCFVKIPAWKRLSLTSTRSCKERWLRKVSAVPGLLIKSWQPGLRLCCRHGGNVWTWRRGARKISCG